VSTLAASARDPGRLRLLCFPHAGGGASAYRGWAGLLPREVEVCPLQLPGREMRLREPALTDLSALVALLVAESESLRSGRFALFGHSLGALVAFEFTRALRRRGEPLPLYLFVSGSPAPQLAPPAPNLLGLDDEAFLTTIRDFAGTPEPVLQDRELVSLLLPTLRADFGLRAGYVCADEPALPLPISAFGGEGDTFVPLSSLFGWRTHTQRSFSLMRFAGDHFYYRDQPVFFRELARALDRITRRGRGKTFERGKHNGTYY
jgi:medium-chain acyl-[acyl-carrier-protein] hydrolase